MYTRSLVLVSTLLCTSLAAAPHLVPVADSRVAAPASSRPHAFFRAGTSLYFATSSLGRNTDLWKTDGTAAGTSRISDFIGLSGAYGVNDPVGTVGNALVFPVYGDSSYGTTGWRSDGTASGTFRILAAPAPVPSGYSDVAIVPADTRIFLLRTQFGGAADLVVSDGSAGNGTFVGSYPALTGSGLVGLAGKLFFVGDDTTLGRQLWVSDGTVLGTHVVRRGVECPGDSCVLAPTSLFKAGSSLYFTTSQGLWRTDGSSGGTVLLAAAKNLEPVNHSDRYLYFRSKVTESTGILWSYDIATGTVRSGASYDRLPVTSTVLDDGRLLSFHDLRTTSADAVTVSDASAAGTSSLGSLPHVDVATPDVLVGVLGRKVFAQGWTAAAGNELWSIDLDGGAPPALFLDLDPRTLNGTCSSAPGPGVVFGNRLLFPAADVNGRELWETDGTVAGTKLFLDVMTQTGVGAISGTVREKAGNTPVAGVRVNLCTVGTGCDDWTRSDANGRYRFDGVLPGDFKVASTPNDVYMSGDTGSTPITVQRGMEVAGADLALSRGAIITGTVTRATTGAPLQALIRVRNADGFTFATAFADVTTGQYRTTAMPSGTYTVSTQTDVFATPQLVEQVYNRKDCATTDCVSPAGDAVTVSAGTTTSGVDFSLHAFGRFGGTVRDESGEPLANIYVTFTNVNDHVATSMLTDAEGRFRTPPIKPGSYLVETTPAQGYGAGRYIAGCTANCTGTPTPVVMVGDDALTGIDVVQPRTAASLAGVMRDSAGVRLPNMTVWLLNSAGNFFSTTTDVRGHFVVSNLPAGTYYPWALAAGELYGGVDCSSSTCSTAGATPVTITATSYATIDFTVRAQLNTVSGRITDALTGSPIRTAAVTLRSPQTGLEYAQTTNIATDGSYTLSLLTRQTQFRVQAASSGYHPQSYRDVPADCAANCPAPLLVGAGTTTGVDFAMRRFGAITGTVTDVITGKPIAGVLITIRGADGTRIDGTQSDSAGRYRWQGANGGSYYVSATTFANTSNYDPQAYPNVDCTGSASGAQCPAGSGSPVVAPDSVDTPGIDFHLRPNSYYGKITGRVVDDETGLPLAGVIVTATRGSERHDVFTDANGVYLLGNGGTSDFLSTGSYYLQASPATPWAVALYGGKTCPTASSCDPTQGTPVNVYGPNTTADANFRLVKVHVLAVTPNRGPLAGGTRVTITGTNFSPAATVMIGGKPATVISSTPTAIVVGTPAGSAGYAHVSVRSATLDPVTLTQGYLYLSSTSVKTRSDFDGDGKSDMLWVNASSGDTWGWLMNGSKLGRSAQITTVTPTYQVQGIGDFDRDGKSDLVWIGPDGDAWIWLMNGLSIKSSSSPYTVATNYRVAGVGDFDGDGQSDLLWFNTVTGDTYLWLMNGSAIGTSKYLYTAAANYRVAGIGDFDGDGKSDIVWFNTATGDTYLWLMNGTTIRSSTYVYGAAANYAITGVGDFDGDGKSDLVWFNNVTGDTYIWLMNGAAIARSSFIYQVASNFRIAGVGDFDGDGKSDLVWRNTSTGDSYVWLMDGTQFTSSTFIYAPTTQWNVPAPGAF